MDKVAALTDRERSDLFEETASAMGLHPAIVEKDFWVCWVLKRLFASELAEHLVFKGGTSLSKVYGLIDRFSEDIDLVLAWGLLGYGAAGLDPWKSQASRSKQQQYNEAFNARCQRYLEQKLCPQLERVLAGCPGVTPSVSQADRQAVEVRYPAAFSLGALRPQVKLEIGPLASWVPSARRTIRPYAADRFPQLFDDPACPVVAITAERTFWEKATILHQQAHRTTPMPGGYSRHYYDLHRLAGSPVKASALADLGLLEAVVLFKQRFYYSAWAKYDEARPGTFRLLPTEQGERELQADYRAMQEMIFGEAPPWSQVLQTLATLEEEINTLQTDRT